MEKVPTSRGLLFVHKDSLPNRDAPAQGALVVSTGAAPRPNVQDGALSAPACTLDACRGP
jgi:hypothetical protein